MASYLILQYGKKTRKRPRVLINIFPLDISGSLPFRPGKPTPTELEERWLMGAKEAPRTSA